MFKTPLKTVALLSIFAAFPALSDEVKKAPEVIAPSPQEMMMKAWEEAATPNEHHKALEYTVGKWKATTKMWFAPKTEPQVSDATAEFISILGGRYIQETLAGTSMGKMFQGIGYTGYDNVGKKYIGIWMDNVSTNVFRTEGESKDKGVTINSAGTFVEPGTLKTKTFRAVTKKKNKNLFTYEHFELDANGKEFKSLEIIYKRG